MWPAHNIDIFYRFTCFLKKPVLLELMQFSFLVSFLLWNAYCLSQILQNLNFVKCISANQHISDQIEAMEREISQTSLKLRKASDEKWEKEEEKKRQDALNREREIMNSDLADDEKEKLLKEHKANTAKMEVGSFVCLFYLSSWLVGQRQTLSKEQLLPRPRFGDTGCTISACFLCFLRYMP